MPNNNDISGLLRKMEERLSQVHSGWRVDRNDDIANHFRQLASDGRYEDIIKDGKNSTDAFIRNIVGVAYHQLGNYDRALCEYFIALILTENPVQHSLILNNLGLWLEDRKLYSTALDVWSLAAGFDPENVSPRLNSAQRQFLMKKPEDACRTLDDLAAMLAEIKDPARKKIAIATTGSVLNKKDVYDDFRQSADPIISATRTRLVDLLDIDIS